MRKTYLILAAVIAMILGVGLTGWPVSGRDLDTTRLALSVRMAKPGSTILLDPGDYGPLKLDGLRFDSPVTLRSRDPARRARFVGSVEITNSRNIRFEQVDFVLPGAEPDATRRLVAIRNSQSIAISNALFKGYLYRAGDPGVFDPASGPAITREQYARPVGYGSGAAIEVRNVEDLVLENLDISDFRFGMTLLGVTRLRISDSVITGTRVDAIRMSDIRDGVIRNNLIANSRPFYNAAGPASFHDHSDHIQFWATHAKFGIDGLTIENNILIQNNGSWTQGIFGRYSISRREQMTPQIHLRNFRVTDNIVSNGHQHGIYLGDVEDSLVEHNIVLPSTRLESLGNAGAVPRIQITTSLRKNPDGSSRGYGIIPRNVVVRGNIVVNDKDPTGIATTLISPALYAEQGLKLDDNMVLGINPGAKRRVDKIFPALSDWKPIRKLGDVWPVPASMQGYGVRMVSPLLAQRVAELKDDEASE